MAFETIYHEMESWTTIVFETLLWIELEVIFKTELSYSTYCDVAWSSTCYSNLNCIFLFQKHTVQLTEKPGYFAKYLFQLRLLDIFSTNSFFIAIFMYSYHHNLLPVVSQCFFTTGGQFHQYNTRIAFQYKSHFCRANSQKFNILYRGPGWSLEFLAVYVSFPSTSIFKNLIERQVLEGIKPARPVWKQCSSLLNFRPG